jgi:hypothetical protein
LGPIGPVVSEEIIFCPTIPPPTKMAAVTKNRKFGKISLKNYLL